MRLASIFTDHMVLQAGKPIKIFGDGTGEGCIMLAGQEVTFHSCNAEWCVTLPAMEYGGPYTLDIVLNGIRSQLKDIYVGEVWLACGQSNMEMPLFRTEYGVEEAEHADNDKIRFFTVPRRYERNTVTYPCNFYKRRAVDTPWQVCTEKSALYFSAIGYYVAKALQKKLGVVIGVIACNFGGVPIETFIDRKYFYDSRVLKEQVEAFDRKLENADWEECARIKEMDRDMWEGFLSELDYDEAEYVRQIGVRAAAYHNKDSLQTPIGVDYGLYAPANPGILFDSMFSRIIPYAVKGMMWYQGEANQWKGYMEKYRVFMRCMRDKFQDPDMPFYAVELAGWGNLEGNHRDPQVYDDRFVTEQTDYNWALTREQQQLATEMDAHNYLITTMELGDMLDIHPIHKKNVAGRMSLKILKYTYGFDIQADQPTYRAARFEEGCVRISLNHAKGLYATMPQFIKMYVADDSHVLKPAKVAIEGEELVLTCSEVAHPSIVRYGFDFYYSGAHIYNEAGLPLAPFRTDRPQATVMV